MSRVRSVAALAALLALSPLSREARAGATVDLLFVGVNGAPMAATNTVTFAPGAMLTMAVVMRNDVPLTVAVFSLNYDLDLDNELDVVSVFQWRGLPINKTASDFFAPIGPFSPTTATFVGSFQGATTNFGGPRVLRPAEGAFAGGYQMGTVVWKVTASANNDGTDIISGLLNFGVDVFGDGGFNLISNQVLLNAATVNLGDFVPEPAAGALLGVGLLGLALLRRRPRGQR